MIRPPADTSKLVIALVLWFFFGMLGIHRIYLGHVGSGLAMLILTILGCVTVCLIVGYVILMAVGIWVFIDLILIITGALAPTDGSRLV